METTKLYLIVGGDSHSFCKNPKKQFISFCTENKDICHGMHKPAVVPNYTLHDYVLEYGSEIISIWDNNVKEDKLITVLHHLKKFIPGLVNYVHFTNLKEGQRFKMGAERAVRIAQQVGKTEIYAPILGQNTMGHSKEGGEDVFLRSAAVVVIQPIGCATTESLEQHKNTTRLTGADFIS